jgi:hypothetical protein
MRLFRQAKSKDWAGVVARVAAALAEADSPFGLASTH